MVPRIFRTKLCSKCKSETDSAGLVKLTLSWRVKRSLDPSVGLLQVIDRSLFLRGDVDLCARCLEVELRAGQRIVRGHIAWYVALLVGIFVIGGPIVRLLQIPDGSRVQVATIVGFIVVALARMFPLPGVWTLLEAPAESRLDVDQAIELAKRANVGTTADAEYFELKRLCTGPKEMEALLVIVQFGGGLDEAIEPQGAPGTPPALPTPDSIVLQPAIGSPESSEDESTLLVRPCSACGGRGRIEREGSRPGFLAKRLGVEQAVEKCSECNGTGAAEVS